MLDCLLYTTTDIVLWWLGGCEACGDGLRGRREAAVAAMAHGRSGDSDRQAASGSGSGSGGRCLIIYNIFDTLLRFF